MSLTSKVLPALQPIKSLPPDFKSSNDALMGEVSEEAQYCAGDTGLFDEDLAYRGNGVSLEDKPSIADEGLESVPLALSINFIVL
ncbi:hypothetical protein SESBI_02039 [Sesbania bispinosa]|nr:hypothetical protein SESBI_02039 [Sesbania bispinosa]